MKKLYHFAIAAMVLFAMAACGNNNANQAEEKNSGDTLTKQAVSETEVPEAPQTITYDHYDWTLTLPNEGWKVDNAYSEMVIEKENEEVAFNVKDWTKTTIEKCAPNGGCLEENRQEDIVTGEYTWTVYTKTKLYGVACYTYDASREMVVRVGAENIEDPKDPRLMTVLKSFAFKTFD